MLKRQLTFILLTFTLVITGCMGAYVNAKLNIHTEKPDISKIGPGTSNDPDLHFYYNVLKDYDNNFTNLTGRTLTDEEKKEFVQRVKATEPELISQFEAAGMNRMDALRSLKKMIQTEKNQQKHSYRPKTLPEGAAWGRIVTGTEIAVGAVDILFDNTSATYFYSTETNEEAVALRRTLYEKMAGLNFANAGWSIGGIFPEAYVASQPEIDRMLMYTYKWNSPVSIDKNTNLPSTDMLQLQFLVKKEDAEFKPGVYAIASVIINKEMQ